MSDHLYEVKFTRNKETSVITAPIRAESASQAKEKLKAQESRNSVKIISSVKIN
jgi:hypothetical protein